MGFLEYYEQLSCITSILNKQNRKRKPPIFTWRYHIRVTISQRNIFFLYSTRDKPHNTYEPTELPRDYIDKYLF